MTHCSCHMPHRLTKQMMALSWMAARRCSPCSTSTKPAQYMEQHRAVKSCYRWVTAGWRGQVRTAGVCAANLSAGLPNRSIMTRLATPTARPPLVYVDVLRI